MSLEDLFIALAPAFDGSQAIERRAKDALLGAAEGANYSGPSSSLPNAFLEVMAQVEAHPVCSLIADMNLPWAPPETSTDPKYIAISRTKAHVEILGPRGLVQSDKIRIGLYGILPNSAYGLRTHPAEEVFVMLAGSALWKRGDAQFVVHRAGERSYHTSMLPHATQTGPEAFMSIYVWSGDISTENYDYKGLPT